MKKVLLVIIGLIMVAFLCTLMFGYTAVIPLSKVKNTELAECENSKINPLEAFNFNEGDWKMYITLSSVDKSNLPSDIRKVNCFKTSDKLILNSLKEKWTFNCNGGDMATVNSDIYLIHNGEIIFTSGLAITPTQQGLQSKNFGWIFSNENIISNALKEFDRVYSPLIIL